MPDPRKFINSTVGVGPLPASAATTLWGVRASQTRRVTSAIVLTLLAATMLSGCAKGKLEDQKFVSVQEAAQWLVNNECDHSGAQQGYPGYDMESGGIGHIDFMCDNGSKYSIDHYKDGFFRAKQTNK